MTTQELDALTAEALFDGQGTTDTEASMRAMGFTEQEIADELAKEAAVALLANHLRGLIVVRDELSGLLGSFAAYKSSKGGDVARQEPRSEPLGDADPQRPGQPARPAAA